MKVAYWITGIIALAICLAMFTFRKKRHIQIAKLASDMVWALNFVFNGGYAGVVQNLFGAVRDSVFLCRTDERKWAQSIWWCVVFCALFATLPLLSWEKDGAKSIFLAVSSVISTISFFVKNPQLTRYLSLPVMALSMGYAIIVNNTFNIVSNCISVTSIVIGIARELICSARERHANLQNDTYTNGVLTDNLSTNIK